MRSRNLFWLGGGIAVGLALGVALPRLRREFGPIVKEASSRAGELAAELTAVIMDHIQKAQEQPVAPSPAPPAERAAS